MKIFKLCYSIEAIALLIFVSKVASAQLEPSCVKNSPERRGEIGCSLVEDKRLPETLKEPMFWHIDRFDSEKSAQAAVTSASVALNAHGTWWLLTIESTVGDHHGGQHVTQVGLPPLPPALKYSMLVMSAYIPPGLTSRVHHHSGVEAFYVVSLANNRSAQELLCCNAFISVMKAAELWNCDNLSNLQRLSRKRTLLTEA